MDERELFALLRKNYGEANREYLKQQVMAAVSHMKLPSRKETMDGLLDWIVEGCVGMNDRYRLFIYSSLALLKEREPRVIQLSELLSYPAKWEFNTPPYLCTEEIDAARMWWRTWRDTYISITGVGTMGANNYGKEWRCWTAWPTEEQRKAAAWEPSKGDRHVQD